MDFSALFSSSFLITAGAMLAFAVFMAIMRTRRKDRGLKPFHGFHSTVGMEDGTTIWGTLKIFPGGIELVYDKPYRSHGVVKKSYMFYTADIDSFLILIRYAGNLTEKQERKRKKSIYHLANRGYVSKGWRWGTNLFRRIKDTVRKVATMIVGQMYKGKKISSGSSSKSQVENMGVEAINVVDDSLYEAMLEQHIGKPVVAELRCPAIDDVVEISGYLLDYSNKFIALANTEHELSETEIVKTQENLETEDYSLVITDKKVVITNKCYSPLLVQDLSSGEKANSVLFLKGSHVKFKKDKELEVKIGKIKHIDVVLPRDLAKIRHAIE